MSRDYKYKIGQLVKMQPFIDSDDIVTGCVVDKTSVSIFVKWDDKKDPIEHFQNEFCDIKLRK